MCTILRAQSTKCGWWHPQELCSHDGCGGCENPPTFLGYLKTDVVDQWFKILLFQSYSKSSLEVPNFHGFYLGFPKAPSSVAVLVAPGVHVPMQILAGAEKTVWFEYQILFAFEPLLLTSLCCLEKRCCSVGEAQPQAQHVCEAEELPAAHPAVPAHTATRLTGLCVHYRVY